MHRLFVGISLTPGIMKGFETFQHKHLHLEGVSWTPRRQFHITVFFLGKIQPEQLDNVLALFQALTRDVREFGLEFSRFEFAPPKKDPRMIWGRWKQSEAFGELVQTLSAAYTQVFPDHMHRKKPIPHTTLARLKQPAQIDQVDFEVNMEVKNLAVQELVMWDSQVDGAGRREYVELIRYPLVKEGW